MYRLSFTTDYHAPVLDLSKITFLESMCCSGIIYSAGGHCMIIIFSLLIHHTVAVMVTVVFTPKHYRKSDLNCLTMLSIFLCSAVICSKV